MTSHAQTTRAPRMDAPVRLRRRPPKRLPPMRPADSVAVAYYAALRDWLRGAHDLVRRLVLPVVMRELADAARARGKRVDAAGGGGPVGRALDEAASRFADRLKPKALEGLAAKFGTRAAKWQNVEWKRQMRAAMGVEVTSEATVAPYIDEWTARNVDLIVTVPEQFFDDIRQRAIVAVETGKMPKDFARELADREGVSLSRAKVIARDQVNKLVGQINGARQKGLGITGYVWRTMQDNRVREAHEALNGQRFSWDAPPPEGHPGDAIQCRCYAEPDVAGLLDAMEAA